MDFVSCFRIAVRLLLCSVPGLFFFSRVCAYVYAPTDLILHVERCASYSIIVRYEENAKKKDSKYENKCSRELPRLLFGFFDLSCTRNACVFLLFFFVFNAKQRTRSFFFCVLSLATMSVFHSCFSFFLVFSCLLWSRLLCCQRSPFV